MCEKFDLIIISVGGVASTYFMEYIENNTSLKINSTRDLDRIKHLHSPESNLFVKNSLSGVPIIYLWNHPLKSIYSHFKRRWHRLQYSKINSRTLPNDIVSFNDFLNKVSAEKKDLFGMQDHFSRWYSYCTSSGAIKSKFIDLRNINDAYLKNKIAEFCNIDSASLCKLNYVENNRSILPNNIDDSVVRLYDEIDAQVTLLINQKENN